MATAGEKYETPPLLGFLQGEYAVGRSTLHPGVCFLAGVPLRPADGLLEAREALLLGAVLREPAPSELRLHLVEPHLVHRLHAQQVRSS